MTTANDAAGLRRVTGWLLVAGAVTFAVAATVLSSTFDWPDILREPSQVVLPAFAGGPIRRSTASPPSAAASRRHRSQATRGADPA